MDNSNLKTNDSVNDEIDLFELWKGLIEEKNIFFGVLLTVVLVALAYVFLAKPWYESKAYLLPPTNESIQEMNALNLLTESDFYQADEVFDAFLQNLVSKEVLNQVFERYGIAELYNKSIKGYKDVERIARVNLAFESFSKDIRLVLPKKSNQLDSVLIELKLPIEPEEVANILNEVLNLAQQKTVKDYANEINSELHIRKQRMLNRLANLRKIEKDRRLDRIQILQEAAKIARVLELSEPMMSGPEVKIDGVAVANQGMPLYYLGYRLLEAELSALKERENDDPFIPKLREIQQDLADLESVTVSSDRFSVVKVDQKALPASKPIKPKKMLIVMVAVVLGSMLGVFVALIRRSLKVRSDRLEKTSG